MEFQNRFRQLTDKINEYIAPYEKDELFKQFKREVSYWYSLRWQMQSNIWNDFRIDSKYGFQLFQKFLKENKPIVIKANGKGIHIIKQFQMIFSDTVAKYGLRGQQTQKTQELKRELRRDQNAFEGILFKSIITSIKDKIYQEQERPQIQLKNSYGFQQCQSQYRQLNNQNNQQSFCKRNKKLIIGVIILLIAIIAILIFVVLVV